MKLLQILPSIITLGNLISGFLAITYIANNYLMMASWLIFIGMLCDMFDGKVARLTHGCSDFGEQLDSLSDLVTFGVTPAFLAEAYIAQHTTCLNSFTAWLFCLPFVVCAACRLARFNVETEQDESSHIYFKGLATPAAAGVIASLVLCSPFMTQWIPETVYQVIMIVSVLSVSLLMVSNIRYVHMGIQLLKDKRRPMICLGVAFFFLVTIGFRIQVLIFMLALGFLSYTYVSPLALLLNNRKTSDSKVVDE